MSRDPAPAGMADERSLLGPQLVETVAAIRPYGPHAVDIRVSLRMPWRRYYFAILAGGERREASRRVLERRIRPLATAGNVLFVSACATLLTVLMFSGAILMSGVVGL